MPSTRDPNSVVNPGPGKIPAGTVTASSFVGTGGGGSALALIEAHLMDVMDAHMASAIGIEPVYPLTGELLLTDVGGPIAGESVLDFIASLKDIMPPRPNYLGYANTDCVLTGVPEWSPTDLQSQAGGLTRSGAFVATHHIWPSSVTSVNAEGNLFPADRGVLALYTTTDGNYLNPATTTLLGALWLGSDPPPTGMPSANFVETSRTGAQTNYTAAGTGLDRISLTYRLPYLMDYSAYPGAPWAGFDYIFYRYQLAVYTTTPITVAPGNTSSVLLVHWRESYATTLTAIQPAALAVNLIQANCYSPAPVAGVFDGGNIETINRHNYTVDTATSPTVSTWSYSAPSGSTIFLSGVSSYNGTGFLLGGASLVIADLFSGGYYTGVVNPPDVPTGFGSPAIATVSFSELGQGDRTYSYYEFTDGVTPFGAANPPTSGDSANKSFSNLTPPTPTAFTPDGDGAGRIRAIAYNPGGSPVIHVGSWDVLFNSHPQTGGSTLSTSTLDEFVDEKYRYVSNYAGSVVSPPLVPAGGDVFSSASALVANNGSLQVIGHRLVYPGVDYSTSYAPSPGPNYAAVRSADSASHIRRYVRVFDTSVARNIGKIRLTGLAASTFAANVAYTGNEATDHLGGAVIQLKVPGVTGWLDLGRAKGDPDLGTTDDRGCRTSLVVSGSDVIVGYDTSAYTVDNGSGEFALLVRIGFIKNGTGEGLTLAEIEWQAP